MKFSWKSEQKSRYRCMKFFAYKCEWKQVFIHIFMQFFMSFYEGQFKQQLCYSFILLISHMVFNPLENGVPVLLDCIKIFPSLMVQMLFSQSQQAPVPNFRKVGNPCKFCWMRKYLRFYAAIFCLSGPMHINVKYFFINCEERNDHFNIWNALICFVYTKIKPE